MTREEILSRYETDETNITSFGPYCNSPIWAPYYHHAARRGLYDGIGMAGSNTIFRFHVTSYDKREFPELNKARMVFILVDRETQLVRCTISE